MGEVGRVEQHEGPDAGDGAEKSWAASVAECSRLLGAWLAEQG